MDKQTVVYPDNGMLFITKNKCYQVLKTHGGSFSALLLSEIRQSEKNLHCIISTMRHSGKENYGDTKSSSWQGLG